MVTVGSDKAPGVFGAVSVMSNRRRSEDAGDEEFDGEHGSDGPGDLVPVYFDVADMSDEETEWRPGLDDTRSMRAGKQGERAVWRLLERVNCRGSRVRTKVWLTRDGEPVTRVDLHPDGWIELDAWVRELEALAAEAERYRRLLAQRDGQQEDGADNASDWSWRRYCPQLG